jgi:hypothetical protein
METAFLLVLLTLNNAGQMAVNFVNTDDLEYCETRARMLNEILTGGGVKIAENRCVPSTLRFTKFTHDGPAKTKRLTYLIQLEQTRVRVTTTPNMEVCKQSKISWESAQSGKVYCATSTQAPLKTAAK